MPSRRAFQAGLTLAAVLPRDAGAAAVTAVDSHAHLFMRGLKPADPAERTVVLADTPVTLFGFEGA